MHKNLDFARYNLDCKLKLAENLIGRNEFSKELFVACNISEANFSNQRSQCHTAMHHCNKCTFVSLYLSNNRKTINRNWASAYFDVGGVKFSDEFSFFEMRERTS